MIVSVLVSLILQNLMRLHVSQCFHCVKTDKVQKTLFYCKVIRLHLSQCFHCVKTDNVHKTRFIARSNAF